MTSKATELLELRFSQELDTLDDALKNLTPERRAELIGTVTTAIEAEIDRMIATGKPADTGSLEYDPCFVSPKIDKVVSS